MQPIHVSHCGVRLGLMRLDQRVIRSSRFGHIERMESDRIAKRVYMGECVSSSLVG